MPTKPECKIACHQLFSRWADERGIVTSQANTFPVSKDAPDFGDFWAWAHAEGYGKFLAFRSVRGARDDVEDWFDGYFGQRWRN